jgi:hypothetical protein
VGLIDRLLFQRRGRLAIRQLAGRRAIHLERQPGGGNNAAAPGTKLGGDTETFGFFGNAIYTPPFNLGIPVTPHIGVGIGALNVTTKFKVNDTKVFD